MPTLLDKISKDIYIDLLSSSNLALNGRKGFDTIVQVILFNRITSSGFMKHLKLSRITNWSWPDGSVRNLEGAGTHHLISRVWQHLGWAQQIACQPSWSASGTSRRSGAHMTPLACPASSSGMCQHSPWSMSPPAHCTSVDWNNKAKSQALFSWRCYNVKTIR